MRQGTVLAPPGAATCQWQLARITVTLFDERERAFENLFAHEEELRFVALARRNQLFARWAADQLRLGSAEYNAYVRSFTEEAVRPEAAGTLIDRVRDDFRAKSLEISDEHIHAAFAKAAAEAARQVRTEVGR